MKNSTLERVVIEGWGYKEGRSSVEENPQVGSPNHYQQLDWHLAGSSRAQQSLQPASPWWQLAIRPANYVGGSWKEALKHALWQTWPHFIPPLSLTATLPRVKACISSLEFGKPLRLQSERIQPTPPTSNLLVNLQLHTLLSHVSFCSWTLLSFQAPSSWELPTLSFNFLPTHQSSTMYPSKLH